MDRLKTVLWFVLAAVAGIFVYQNEAFFMTKQVVVCDIFIKKFQSPPLPIIILFLCCFFIGFLIAFLLGFFKRRKDAKRIKSFEKELAAKKTNDSIATEITG